MPTLETETVIVGSGLAGVLVARELAAAGQRCTIVERGSMLSWQDQARLGRWQDDLPTSAPNHENDPAAVDYPWTYVYGVGGSCNRWAGTTPRFLPEDFEVRSRFGIMRDWPLTYSELAPYYRAAERAMGVAGADNPLMPATDYPVPAHPPGGQDRALEPHLQPMIPLPQARPTEPLGTRAACCGSGRCQLCPVNARFSVLNTLAEVFERPDVELLTKTVAAKLVSDQTGQRVAAVDCIREGGERVRVRAKRFVVAANGIESAGLLQRSDIVTRETGLYLFDHHNSKLVVRVNTDTGVGIGSSLATSAIYSYYSGEFRRHRAGVLILPFNPGASTMGERLVRGLVEGRTGRRLRREVATEWRQTFALDLYIDDTPNARNRVTLSARKDSLGLPLNRVHYERPTGYWRRGVDHVREDIPRRLRSLGARDAQFLEAPQGAHLLGTLRMGSDEGAVVDRHQRHRRRENLFVSGGAVFPTYSPAHPTLTIAALAIRLGRYMALESV
jgi:choline dehydrogenase-like flavoprotein